MASAVRTIDVASFLEDRKLGSYNYKIIILSWLITVFDGFDMLMISFTAPYMRDELGLDTLMLGNVFSAGLFGMMLGGFFFGYLGDRIGRRPTILISATCFGVLTLATAFAQDYHQLLALRFLDGFAIGGMLPLAWALNIELVPQRFRATVITVIMMGFSLGTALAAPLTVWLAPDHGWEGVFMAGGAGTLVCALLLILGLPESPRFLTAKGRKPEAVARILNRLQPTLDARADDRFILSDEHDLPASKENFRLSHLFAGDLKWITPLLWLAYTASSLAVYFSASWGPLVLEALKFDRDTAAFTASIGGLLGAVAGLFLMRFTDGKGPFAVAVYPIIAIPILLVLGFMTLSPELFLPGAILAAAVIGGEHFGVLSIAGIFYPSAIRANGAGWATSVAKVGAIIGPLVGAWVLASGVPVVRTYALLAVCPAIIAVSAIGIGIVVRRRNTSNIVTPATAATA